MDWLTRTDVLLLAVAAYVAVMSLVRMMQRRRDQVVADVQRQVAAHRKRSRPSQTDRSRDAA
jgi:hypothetical protein